MKQSALKHLSMLGLILIVVLASVSLSMNLMLYSADVTHAQFEVIEPEVTGDQDLVPRAAHEFTVTGYNEGDRIEVTLNGATLARGVADSSGELLVTPTIPTQLAYGEYVVSAKNQEGVEATGYDAQILPKLVVQTASGAPGSKLVINGYGFGSQSTYTVIWSSAYSATSGLTLGTGTTSKIGSLFIQTTVPLSDTGTYFIRGTSDNADDTWVPEITPTPSPTPTATPSPTPTP